MKKLLTFLLCISLIFALCACGSKTNKLDDINESLYYEQKGITFITEKTEYSTDVKEISYTITNISTGEECISGDQHFELHYKTENGWKMVCHNKDVTFNALARVLQPNESVTQTINLEEYFYLPLQSGEYRITDSYSLSNVFKIS
ncbi:MAG: hypothetical protein Q4B40_02300 [Clostridia bacterium]|nr:hypothetical protein [Clostridia bacterium]